MTSFHFDTASVTQEWWAWGLAFGLTLSADAMAQAAMGHTDGGVWETLAPMNEGRRWPSVAEIAGTIYVFGGNCGDCGSFPGELDSVEKYDPDTNTWTYVSPMPEKIGSAGVAVHGGKAYVFGGVQLEAGSGRSVYVYDPDVDTWSQLPNMPSSMDEANAIAWGDTIFVVGGRADAGSFFPQKAYAFDPDSVAWEELNVFLGDGVGSHQTLAALGPFLFLFCGIDDQLTGQARYRLAQRYDIERREWRFIQPVGTPRYGAGVAELSGRFFVCGGVGDTAALDIYDPISDEWSEGPPMPTPRKEIAVVRLGERFLAIGGSLVSSVALPTVEAFRPRARSGVTPFCFCGQNAPCNNASWTGGCVNASLSSGSLSATGSTSIIADDLLLTGTRLPATQLTIAVLGATALGATFGNGLACVKARHGLVSRFLLGTSGLAGEVQFGPGIIAISESSGVDGLAPGTTWAVQFVFRDPGTAMCPPGWNSTNAVAITFSP